MSCKRTERLCRSGRVESVNHAVLTRNELHEFSVENGMTDRLLIPGDGEAYSL